MNMTKEKSTLMSKWNLKRGPAPFGAVCGLAAMFFFSASLVNNGVFFIARNTYGFGEMRLFVLGLISSLVWIPSPFSSARITRHVAERTFSIVLLICMAATTTLPLIISATTKHSSSSSTSWTLYLLVGLYGLFCNHFCCINESYGACGRGSKLLHFMSLYNANMAMAAAAAFFVATPFLSHPLELLASLAAVHVASIALLFWHPQRPGESAAGDDVEMSETATTLAMIGPSAETRSAIQDPLATPRASTDSSRGTTPRISMDGNDDSVRKFSPRASMDDKVLLTRLTTPATATEKWSVQQLRTLFHWVMPLVYVFFGTVNPYLPVALTACGVPSGLQTIVTSTWMVSRLLAFLIMWRSKFWHGRASAAFVSVTLCCIGLVAVFIVPTLSDFGLWPISSVASSSSSSSSSTASISWMGLSIVLPGLFIYGLGLAGIANGALCYTIEGGTSGVSSTALFEFVSSLGTIVGPVVGLVVFGLKSREIIAPRLAPLLTVCVVFVVVVALTTTGAVKALLGNQQQQQIYHDHLDDETTLRGIDNDSK